MDPEKDRREASLAAMDQTNDVVVLHPASVEVYRRKIAELEAALRSDEHDRLEAANHLRSMVSAIEVYPGEGRGNYELRVRGVFAELLNMPNRQPGEAQGLH